MKLGISLFSSGGIGDLALRASGVHMLVANEILPDRVAAFRANYPETTMIVGDINTHVEAIIATTQARLKGRKLDVLFATPPCQGMSKNGRGKLLAEARQGRRSAYDERNRLIVPTVAIIQALQPELVVFENVPEMEDTIIIEDGQAISILDFVRHALPDYTGMWKTVEFANYGVPQKRQRLITVFTKNKKLTKYMQAFGTFLPSATHSHGGEGNTLPWVTLRDAIGSVPPLDAKSKKTAQDPVLAFHRVPVLDEDKYFWVEHTPEGKSAFSNQCVRCGCQANKNHGTTKQDGINQSCKDTPLYCMECGALLPRPWVKENDTYRLMRGYTSAYKRMSWDLPSSALTRNMSYACSDNKLHPEQNRVLSLYEAFILHTITDYEYNWKRDDAKISDKTIREIIGESIPPRGLECIIRNILGIIDGNKDIKNAIAVAQKKCSARLLI